MVLFQLGKQPIRGSRSPFLHRNTWPASPLHHITATHTNRAGITAHTHLCGYTTDMTRAHTRLPTRWCKKDSSRSYHQLLTASHTQGHPDAAEVVAIEINRLLSHSEKRWMRACETSLWYYAIILLRLCRRAFVICNSFWLWGNKHWGCSRKWDCWQGVRWCKGHTYTHKCVFLWFHSEDGGGTEL